MNMSAWTRYVLYQNIGCKNEWSNPVNWPHALILRRPLDHRSIPFLAVIVGCSSFFDSPLVLAFGPLVPWPPSRTKTCSKHPNASCLLPVKLSDRMYPSNQDRSQRIFHGTNTRLMRKKPRGVFASPWIQLNSASHSKFGGR